MLGISLVVILVLFICVDSLFGWEGGVGVCLVFDVELMFFLLLIWDYWDCCE